MRRGEGHWLAAVADVLRATTADLRELALAAGRNPATFYKGVDLAGADLRGQDLRGMEFSEIDLSRVLIDDNTLIDEKYIRKSTTEIRGSPIIFLAVDNNIRDSLKDLDKNYNCYPMESYDSFIRHAKDYSGPKFIITDSSNSFAAHSGIVNIALVSEARFSLREFDSVFQNFSEHDIIIPVSISVGKNFSASILDFIEQLDVNWFQIPFLLSQGKALVFLRARGSGANPSIDALVRLHAQASGMRLSLRGFRLGPPYQAPQSVFESALMPGLVGLDMNMSRRMRRYQAAGLFELERSGHDRTLGAALGAFMSESGWTVETLSDDEFRIVGASRSFIIKMAGRSGPREFEPNFDNIEILNVFPILPDGVAASKINSLSINVAAADLALFKPDPGSIWDLIRFQSERVASSRDSTAKAVYFLSIMNYALRSSDYSSDSFLKLKSQINSLKNYRQITIYSEFSVRFIGRVIDTSSFHVNIRTFDPSVSFLEPKI